MSIPGLRLCAGVTILAYAAAAALVFQIGRPDVEAEAFRPAPLSVMVGRHLADLRRGPVSGRVVAITRLEPPAA